MPGVRGTHPRGRNGSIEILDGVIVLKEERGMISKRLQSVAEVPLEKATSITYEDKQGPSQRTARLTVGYETEDEASELVFLTEDAEGLEPIRAKIDAEIERRRVAHEREMTQRRLERESHVNHLTLVLELVDHVFQILLDLHGIPKWGNMDEHIPEAARIVGEMEKLEVVAPLNVDPRGLSAAVADRRPDEIKEEAYAILSVIHRDSERLANYEGVGGFELEHHEAFVKTYLLLWDLYLGEHLDGSVDEEEIEDLVSALRTLEERIIKPECKEELRGLRSWELLDGVIPRFEGMRLLILRCLESLVEP